jgi:hypothetical protein
VDIISVARGFQIEAPVKCVRTARSSHQIKCSSFVHLAGRRRHIEQGGLWEQMSYSLTGLDPVRVALPLVSPTLSETDSDPSGTVPA